MGVLIGGVVLLTNKKPEPKAPAQTTIMGPVPRSERRGRQRPKVPSSGSIEGPHLENEDEGGAEDDALRLSDGEEDASMWQIGDDDDGNAEDGDDHIEPVRPPLAYRGQDDDVHEEVHGLMDGDENGEHEDSHRHGADAVTKGLRTVPPPALHADQDGFGDWEDGGVAGHRR